MAQQPEGANSSLVEIINSPSGRGWATVRVLRLQKPEHRKVMIADGSRALYAIVPDLDVLERLLASHLSEECDVFVERAWETHRISGNSLAELRVFDIREPTSRCDEIVMSPRVLVFCEDHVFLPCTPESDDNIISMKFLTRYFIKFAPRDWRDPQQRQLHRIVAGYFESITDDLSTWPTSLLKWYTRLDWESPHHYPNQCRPLNAELARSFRSSLPDEIVRLIQRMKGELEARAATVYLDKYTLFGGEANERAADGTIETLREAAVRELLEETSAESRSTYNMQDLNFIERSIVETRRGLRIRTPVFCVELTPSRFERLEVREGGEHRKHCVRIADVIRDLSLRDSKYSTLFHMGGDRREWTELFESLREV